MPVPDGDGASSGRKKPKNAPRQKSYTHWVLRILILTFFISTALSLLSNQMLDNVGLVSAGLILLFFVAVGILFDIIGVAVTAADETPFHSMAAKKVEAARQAVTLIRNAEKVSNFCNDVVGDICGIISGTTAAVIVGYLVRSQGNRGELFFGTVITALVASLTVGGKALGKSFAINSSNAIVYRVAQISAVLKTIFLKEKKG